MPKVPRLYNNFKPARYELFLDPNKNKLVFYGKVKIIGTQIVGNEKLVLHSVDLDISKILINNTMRNFCFNKSKDHLIIDILGLDVKDLVIEIDFSANITNQMHGLYPCIGRDGDIILATQFESHSAREVFPCIDEPEAKAIFNLTIAAVKDDVVLSNTNIIDEKVIGDYKTCKFEDTPLMSTYLLAFVVGKLINQKTTTQDGTTVNAWATPDQGAFTTYALEITVKSLEFFTDYFSIAYPLNKCDIVALPDFASGAMENWGLLTFRETCMLVDPNNTSLDSKQYVAMVVAHEVAHQWFGNLVTMRWWNDLWLNEGFASWIEYMAVDYIHPDWHMWTQFIANEQQTAFRLDALKNTHPIEVDVPNPELIPTIFDGISYSKGACVIHMLHEYLGKDNFRRGLTHYLSKYAYQNSETADLWHALSEASSLPVADFMSSWTTQAGFPYLNLKQIDNKLELTQQRFLASGQNIKSDVWPIPLLSPDTKIDIVTTKKTVITLDKSSDIKLNVGQAGFYLTKYWPEAYKNIAIKIQNNQIPEADRIGLLTDMLALTKAGHLPATQLLSILSSFKNEASAPVWDCMAVILSDIRQILGNEVRQAIKPFTLQLVQAQLLRLGWEELSQESHFDKLLRPLILSLASSANNIPITEEANRQFDEAKSISDLGSNLRNMIIICASQNGSKNEYTKMLNMLKTTTSPEDKIILARGLTNFRHPAEYNQALKLIKSKYVKLQDSHHWIIYGLNNPVLRDNMWNWIKINWGWLKQNFDKDMAYSRLPVYISRSFNSKDKLVDYEDFFKKAYEPSLERGIKQGVETIKAQIAWRERDEKAVLDWLKLI